jgi:nucleoside-triphosphatase THEP1
MRPSPRPRAVLLAGPVFSGKSRFVEALAGSLAASGRAVGGFVQRGVFDAGGRKVGYDLVGLSSGSCRRIANRREDGAGWRFEDGAFADALGEVRAGAELVVIDEVGPIELAGRGHAAAVDRALSICPAVLVVVREALLDEVTRWISPRAAVTVLSFGPDRERVLAGRVLGMIPRGRDDGS